MLAQTSTYSTKAQYSERRILAKMNVFMSALLKDDGGQDLIEYTLLMAFVALASAGLFIGAGGSINAILTTTNAQLAVANTAAS